MIVITKKILIIDDEADVLQTIEQALTSEGHHITTTTNAQEALQYVKENPFDIVLLDVLMPMSGYDLVKRLKAHQKNVAKTMFITIVPKQEVDLQEIDGFVQKPFTIKALVSEVNRVLAQ